MIVVRRSSACVLLFILTIPLALFAGELAKHESSFKLLAQSADGWDVQYTSRPRAFTTVIIDGKSHFRFVEPTLSGGDEDVVGTPELPTDALPLGIPFGTTLNVELINPEFETMDQQAIAPHPAYEITEEQEAVEVLKKNIATYSRNEFFPTTQISVEPPFTLRQQCVGTIRIRPYQYNPSAQTLRRLVKATLRIRLQSVNLSHQINAVVPSNSADPYFEETYKSLLWNYQQAKAWRSIQVQRTSPLSDSTRDWFETGKNYYKTLVGTDGWYKITRADIQAAGGNLSSIDLASLKVFAKGAQIPIVARPDTTIEFYAYRNYGDSAYYDFYTDTSAYWLTWGGTAGNRFTPSSASGAPTATVTSAKQTTHVEQNWSYYTGTTQSEQIEINTVAGEGWYWRWFNTNTQIDFSFSLDSIDTSAPTATIRARMWGTGYVNPPGLPAQHKARFWINDSLIGDVDFGQRQAGLLNATVAASWLKVGNNILRVKNIDTGTSGNSFYLDWFEIDYQRNLRPTNDQLLFVSPNSSGGSPTQFFARGFSNSQIEVFDLSDKKTIAGGTVSGDSATGFAISFQDTFSAQRTYVVVCSGSQRVVPPLKQKMFADIRVNPQGADYVIISHRNYLAQANQLATHRQSTNAVRTKVIDVDDIYDEFNYGVMNATKIKTFLKHAYSSWTGPSVAYVLFFGDASWDYHRYLSNTIKTNFVPSYGIPTGDNWFGCFDSLLTFIPSLYIGRIPAENTTQAQSAVNKIIGYDSYALSEWNKNFLMITGGNTLSEQTGFNYLSESSIGTYIKPAPFGGTPLRIYKTTPGYIDGEHKQELKDLLRNGLVFMSFTGHSGGRIWGVDPGPAGEFENTNGKLPFVSSVSCNVGGFATPANSVFAEDLVLADNRGAIASWASSSLGYATYGAALTNYWLANATADSVREFGKLTTNARYQLWFETGSGYITIAMVNLNPLIGDPMSKMAVPLRPDLAIAASDISVNKLLPTPNDSSLTVRVNIHNYGLVPTDSVGITLTDIYNGQTTYLLYNKKLRQTLHTDSVFISWNGRSQVGLHTLVAGLDPMSTIVEVNELNNIASSDQYIYTNNLFVVKPLNTMAVSPGVQRLVVTSPIGYDSSGFTYMFELDTVDTFNSPALVSSGAVVPDNVKGEWLTPSLPSDKVYFWRARTMHGSLAGNWVTSSFSTSTDLPTSLNVNAPFVRIRENSKKQYVRDALVNTAATDTGVTIAPRVPLYIYCRSVGFRYNQYIEYYSSIKVNDQKVIGFWWELGNSFMVARINDFTGTFEFRNYDVRSSAALADSMKDFINNTPVGNYIAVSVIFDGQTNVNEGLKQAMDSVGATQFRSILYGQSYAFIGRKWVGGPGMTALEQLTNDTAVVSLTVPNFYSYGNGSITSSAIPVVQTWDSLHWRRSGDMIKTNPRLALIGLRSIGGIDTLRVLSKDSIDVNLSSLNPVTSGPRYSAIKVAGLLSTSDANVTPALTAWWIDCTLPADLAVSARTLGLTQASTFNFPITVYNIGYQKSDSVRVVVTALDKYNRSRQVAGVLLDSIIIDGSRSIVVPISTTGLPRKTILQVVVGPARKGRDLIAENNTAYYTFYNSGIVPVLDVQVYADGRMIMDGDYVSARPTIVVKTDEGEGEGRIIASQLDVKVDNERIHTVASQPLAKSGSSSSASSLEHTFTPTLSNGAHKLRFRLGRMNSFGEVDTVEHAVSVNVLNESRILQMYNYPNPFATETYFTFMLSGAKPPESLRIQVFTVSGRKIRELLVSPSALQIGFNRVYWDGRDEDGDEVANGYYFYQAVMSADGKSVSAIEKLAKVK